MPQKNCFIKTAAGVLLKHQLYTQTHEQTKHHYPIVFSSNLHLGELNELLKRNKSQISAFLQIKTKPYV